MNRDWIADTVVIGLAMLIPIGIALAWTYEQPWWFLLSALSLIVFCAG